MEPIGLVRYSLTVHFQANDLLHDLWQCAPNRILVRCVARATGEIWRPSQESDESYLRRYFERQSLKIIDPTDALPENDWPESKGKALGIDLRKEAIRQVTNPISSVRWRTMRKTVLDRDGWTCKACGYQGSDLHIDHIKPRHKFPHLVWDMDNIQTLCKSCHCDKTARDQSKWKHKPCGPVKRKESIAFSPRIRRRNFGRTA